ncbi:hypothetical protein ACROYT_G014056 [Oculina patagonica]
MYCSDLPSPQTLDIEFERWLIKWQTELTKPDSLQPAFEACDPDIFPNINYSLRIACTIPVTSVDNKRANSTLKLVKGYLWTTMTIKRLSGLALMNIHEKFYEGLKNGSFNSCKGVSQHEEYSKNEEEGLIGQCSKKKPTLNQDQHISLFCKRRSIRGEVIRTTGMEEVRLCPSDQRASEKDIFQVTGQKLLAENLQKQQKLLLEQILCQQEVLDRQQQAISQLSMSSTGNSQQWQPGCFGCGSRNHMKRDCLSNRQNQRGGNNIGRGEQSKLPALNEKTPRL